MKQIVIVDDTATNLRILEILLKKCGCEVKAFILAEDCLQWASSNIQHADLVIVDYQMPGMNGDQLAAELRRVGCTCHIIILTGYSGLSRSVINPSGNIGGIMNKPISIADVSYMVKRWSAKGQVMDARRETRLDAVSSDHEEIFLYRDGFYISMNAHIINRSDNGIALYLEPKNSGFIATGNEIVLKDGINYSIRWSRQREEGQYCGGCSIHSVIVNK